MTPRFPVDAPIRDVLRALQGLGFVIAREGITFHSCERMPTARGQ